MPRLNSSATVAADSDNVAVFQTSNVQPAAIVTKGCDRCSRAIGFAVTRYPQLVASHSIVDNRSRVSDGREPNRADRIQAESGYRNLVAARTGGDSDRLIQVTIIVGG